MIKVRIIKNWDKPNFFRQTPKNSGIWNNVLFTEEEIKDPDYVIILNYAKKKIRVSSYKENIWCIIQEPPNEYFKNWHKAGKVFFRVFTTDETQIGERYTHSQPAIPWLINKSYDELINIREPIKPSLLSCITSVKSFTFGHRERLNFLNKVKRELEFDLIATEEYYKNSLNNIKKRLTQFGFNKIVKDKWEGLAPYRYSLIIENYQGRDYFSEKLSDSYLAFTMPIYFGCRNISDYFPKESLIAIDLTDKYIVEKIREIIKSDLWKKRKKYIRKARDLVLNHYQFFPFMSREIDRWKKESHSIKEKIVIPKRSYTLAGFSSFLKRYLFNK